MCEISVIIPAYNAEKYLPRCIDSIRMQTCTDLEILIIDDGSTDTTYQLASSFCKVDSRVRVFRKENEGQGIARNLGLEQAQGTFIAFVDSDDYIAHDMYQCMLDQANTYQADLVYSYMEGETFLTAPPGKPIDHGLIITSPEDIRYIKSLFIGGLPDEKEDSRLGMSACRSIYKKDIIKKHHILFESERRINSEDLLFNIDFTQFCKRIVFVNRCFYYYCLDNPTSFSRKQNLSRYQMFKCLYHEMEKKCDHDDLIRVQRRLLANTRVVLVEISRWTTRENFKSQKQLIREIVNDPELQNILKNYPLRKLSWMQRIYFYVMKQKWTNLIILIPKLRYKFL